MITTEQAYKLGEEFTNFGDPHKIMDTSYGTMTRLKWQEEEVKNQKRHNNLCFIVKNNKGETAIFRAY